MTALVRSVALAEGRGLPGRAHGLLLLFHVDHRVCFTWIIGLPPVPVDLIAAQRERLLARSAGFDGPDGDCREVSQVLVSRESPSRCPDVEVAAEAGLRADRP